jgi:hypothetical protein
MTAKRARMIDNKRRVILKGKPRHFKKADSDITEPWETTAKDIESFYDPVSDKRRRNKLLASLDDSEGW